MAPLPAFLLVTCPLSLSGLRDGGAARKSSSFFETLEGRLRREGCSKGCLNKLRAEEPGMVWNSIGFRYDGSGMSEERVEALTSLRGADLLKSREEPTAAIVLVFALSAALGVLSAQPAWFLLPLVLLVPGLFDNDEDRRRRRRHETAHLVAGHAVGLSAKAFEVRAGAPRVEFDAPLERRRRDAVETLAVVAVAGAVAEAAAFGDARGAKADFEGLQAALDGAVPPYASPADQQDATRRAVVRAFDLLGLPSSSSNSSSSRTARLPPSVLDAAEAAIAEGRDLPGVIAAIERANALERE